MDSKVHRQWSKVRTCVMCSSFCVFPIKKHHFEPTGRRANSNTKCDPAIKQDIIMACITVSKDFISLFIPFISC